MDCSALRKRRSSYKSSLQRIDQQVMLVEDESKDKDVVNKSKSLIGRLNTFRDKLTEVHEAIIVQVDDPDLADKDVQTFEDIQEVLEDLLVRLEDVQARQSKETATATPTDDTEVITITKLLRRWEVKSEDIRSDIDGLTLDISGKALLKVHSAELDEGRLEIKQVYHRLLQLPLEDGHSVIRHCEDVEKTISKLNIKLQTLKLESEPEKEKPGVKPTNHIKLQSIKIPTFNGDVLHWNAFWDQFKATVHDRPLLSDTEKLVYLRQALVDSPANKVIASSSTTGKDYDTAVQHLLKRYHQPRLVHERHVRRLTDLAPMKSDSNQELQRIHDEYRSAMTAIRSTEAAKADPLGCYVLASLQSRLDKETLFAWREATKADVEVIPAEEQFLTFLQQRATSAGCLTTQKASNQSNRRPTSEHKAGSYVAATSKQTVKCSCCREAHPLYICDRFKRKSVAERRAFLSEEKGCFNCLKPGHRAGQCLSNNRCKTCSRSHHTLLHQDQVTSPVGDERPERPATIGVAGTVQPCAVAGTCRVVITSPSGKSATVRALFDTGAEVSFITSKLSEALQLKRIRERLSLTGIGGEPAGKKVEHSTTFKLHSIYNPDVSSTVTAYIIPRITSRLPSCDKPSDNSWQHLDGLQLADPDFNKEGPVDILLNSDLCFRSIHQSRVGPKGTPSAINTTFGWVVGGGQPNPSITSSVLFCKRCEDDTNNLLAKFWKVEEPPKDQVVMSSAEKEVVSHFLKTHSREESGRFTIPLPRKAEHLQLGESRSQALRRFLSLEKRLHQSGQFPTVNTVMEEYLKLQHAELVPPKDLKKGPEATYYLPVQVVTKVGSTTTKVRAVFDASAKTSTGISLNDTLSVGPTVHPPLLEVLMLFRNNPIAITADVSKMYRAIALDNSDKDYHRFLWRSSKELPIQDLRMTRVTFGVAASSFAANMAVRQNAKDFEHLHPQAAEVVRRSFYVDDCLTGASTVDEAIKLRNELQALLSKGCFELRKWNSSDTIVLRSVPPDLRDADEVLALKDDAPGVAKTLGIIWDTRHDVFKANISKPDRTLSLTKRTLLSDTSKLFDVIGLFTPTILLMKILMQRTWELDTGWDDPLPEDIYATWKVWRDQLHCLEEVSIPRYHHVCKDSIVSYQLHGYSDASELAYGGVVYLRTTHASGVITTSIILAKSKVAPLKRQSIPRLELCGAALLTRLIQSASKLLKMSTTSIYCWTDSTIVLAWLQGNPRRFKTFVGNRVSEILNILPAECWNHVPTLENPADHASRGLQPKELVNNTLWWQGPAWLIQDSTSWPKLKHTSAPEAEQQEVRVSLAHYLPVENILDIKTYSTLNRLTRVTAWVLRFVNKARKIMTTNSKQLTAEELLTAELYHTHVAQDEEFANDIIKLKAANRVSTSSSLSPLTPFVDKHGTLRVGGRLSNSGLAPDAMHPAILRGNHFLTKLIIRAEHVRLLHAGPTATFSSLSRRFHLVGGLKAVRSVTKSCVPCRRQLARTSFPKMGQLPESRVNPGHAFNHTGIDFAGPITVRAGCSKRGVLVKSYVCVFVCLAVKAVHLELVSSQTAECFLAALKRFISRRGIPSIISSDNGTGFIKANKDLALFCQYLCDQDESGEVSNYLISQRIVWKFIPQRSPHFGGLWESAVRSIKSHLKRVLGEARVNFEEMTTILSQIEACLNSRPLAPMSSPNEEGVEPLTPGHFLVGRPLCALPDTKPYYSDLTSPKRWKLCESLTNHWWKRWSSDYLHTLNRIYKGKFPSRNLKPGDVVLVHDWNLLKNRWPMARIVKTYTGKDGVVRVVDVKTSQAIYRRAVVNLTPLVEYD